MIPCESCHKRPATIHLTDIRDDVKREVHLCAECAKKSGFTPAAALQLPQLLGAIAHPAAAARRRTRRTASPTCPHCGITWAEFRRDGRLGCPEDYRVFRGRLLPLIEQAHDATRHVGDRPPGAPALADDAEDAPSASSAPLPDTVNPEFSIGKMIQKMIGDGPDAPASTPPVTGKGKKPDASPAASSKEAAGDDVDDPFVDVLHADDWRSILDKLMQSANDPSPGAALTTAQFIHEKIRELLGRSVAAATAASTKTTPDKPASDAGPPPDGESSEKPEPRLAGLRERVRALSKRVADAATPRRVPLSGDALDECTRHVDGLRRKFTKTFIQATYAHKNDSAAMQAVYDEFGHAIREAIESRMAYADPVQHRRRQQRLERRTRLTARLERAVQSERYEEAARLRDRIAQLTAWLDAPPPPSDDEARVRYDVDAPTFSSDENAAPAAPPLGPFDFMVGIIGGDDDDNEDGGPLDPGIDEDDDDGEKTDAPSVLDLLTDSPASSGARQDAPPDDEEDDGDPLPPGDAPA